MAFLGRPCALLGAPTRVLSRALVPGAAAAASAFGGQLRCLSSLVDAHSRSLETATLDSLMKGILGEEEEIICVDASSPVLDALALMTEKVTSGLLVTTGEQEKVVGLISEQDYIDNVTHGSFIPDDIVVEQIMSKVWCAQRSTSLKDAATLLHELTRRHLPVMKIASVEDVTLALEAGDETSSITKADIRWKVSVRHLLRGALNRAREDALHLDAKREAEPDEAATGDSSSMATAITGELTDHTDTSEGEHSDSPQPAAVDDIYRHLRPVSTILDSRKAESRVVLNTRMSDEIDVATAANEMATRLMGVVFVVDDDGILQGVFTSRDYVARVVVPGLNARKTLVADVMSDTVICASPNDTIEDVAEVMLSRQVRRLPVVDPEVGSPIGALTIMDLLLALVPAGSSKPQTWGLRDYFRLMAGSSSKSE